MDPETTHVYECSPGIDEQGSHDIYLHMVARYVQTRYFVCIGSLAKFVDRSSLLTLSHRRLMHQAGRVKWHGLHVEVQGVLTRLSAAVVSTCIEPAGLSLA